MTFEPIVTQEQLDAIIKERVERAKKTAIKDTEERFGDYETLKKKAEEAQNLMAEKEKRIKELEEAEKGRIKEVDELKGNVEALKLERQKVTIATQVGLPVEMATRLSGDDAEAIKADAEALKELMGTKSAPPLGGYDKPDEGDSKREALRSMLKGMREE